MLCENIQSNEQEATHAYLEEPHACLEAAHACLEAAHARLEAAHAHLEAAHLKAAHAYLEAAHACLEAAHAYLYIEYLEITSRKEFKARQHELMSTICDAFQNGSPSLPRKRHPETFHVFHARSIIVISLSFTFMLYSLKCPE